MLMLVVLLQSNYSLLISFKRLTFQIFLEVLMHFNMLICDKLGVLFLSISLKVLNSYLIPFNFL